jgi:AcrR family transcriptional regulator
VAFSSPATAKGVRQADAIIAAAIRCLGRDGYSASSIGRIAGEAGVQKRMVLYYFESREQLFDAVVRRIGDQLLAQVEGALAGLEDPAELVAAGFDELWGRLTNDRALLSAYYGLVAESVTDPSLRDSVGEIGEGYRRLIRRLAREVQGGGRVALDEPVLTVLMIAGIRGLMLEYLEHGDTPELQDAIGVFQGWLSGAASPRR